MLIEQIQLRSRWLGSTRLGWVKPVTTIAPRSRIRWYRRREFWAFYRWYFKELIVWLVQPKKLNPISARYIRVRNTKHYQSMVAYRWTSQLKHRKLAIARYGDTNVESLKSTQYMTVPVVMTCKPCGTKLQLIATWAGARPFTPGWKHSGYY